MQEALSQPLQPPAQPFSDFLRALLQALARERVRCCILRNYEGFPDRNVGNDVDFLISPFDLQRAIGALRSVAGVRIIGYVERSSVALVYLEGISPLPHVRTLEVDFDLRLDWKGLPFLTTAAVLENAIPRQAGNVAFLVPSQVHEATISLFASLLVGGWLKEKYFPKVQQTFASDRSGVIDALLPQFGLKASTRLVDSVICGDRREVLGTVRSLRTSLALRSLLRRPIRSIPAIVQHYTREFAIRFSPDTLETVCVLGPGHDSKTRTVEAVIVMLRSSAAQVEKCHLRFRLAVGRQRSEMAHGSNYDAETPAGSLISMAKIVLCLVEERLSRLSGRKNLSLRVYESCYHELLIDPQRYRYGGPMWFARLVGKLFPSPDLWILLDSTTGIFQSGDRQIPPTITHAQLAAYRSFVKTRKRYVILDASGPADSVAEGAYAAIIDALAERADRKLENRFQQRKTSN